MSWSVVCDCGISRLTSLAFCIHLSDEMLAGYFTENVFLLSCGCLYSVFLPRGAMSWYVVCDCGISWSFSLVFFLLMRLLLRPISE